MAGATLLGQPRSRAAFGDYPNAASMDAGLPAERQVDSVLEVFLFGGLSQYESLYLVDEHDHWKLFDGPVLDAALTACGLGTDPLFEAFGQDAENNTVNLGPFVLPLRQRPDVLARMRLAVVAHGAAPHEVAIPLALAGRGAGSPNLAGLGAHVQRAVQETQSGSTAPSAYFLLPTSQLQSELVASGAAIGRHPGTTRPLAIRAGAAASFLDQLERPQLGDSRAAFDALVKANVESYQRRRLTFRGDAIRAGSASSLRSATTQLEDAQQLLSVLDADLFVPVESSACNVSPILDETAMNLRLAAHLLTHPVAPARYICVVDGGLLPVEGAAGGYDTHEESSTGQAQNLTSMLASLMSIINEPGETDPNKLDLDRTMIVLNTEFGRSPDEQGLRGRGHWPTGFPIAFIGGPVQSSGIAGGINASAAATTAISPSTHRVAVLGALGLWPFADEAYNVSDVLFLSEEPADSELEAFTSALGYCFG
jgi:Protein of unknown function (DUF1501)